MGAEGGVRHALFFLNGQVFISVDSAAKHDFTFTPAIRDESKQWSDDPFQYTISRVI